MEPVKGKPFDFSQYLPTEVQAEIGTMLDIASLLKVRETSKSLKSLVDLSVTPIVVSEYKNAFPELWQNVEAEVREKHSDKAKSPVFRLLIVKKFLAELDLFATHYKIPDEMRPLQEIKGKGSLIRLISPQTIAQIRKHAENVQVCQLCRHAKLPFKIEDWQAFFDLDAIEEEANFWKEGLEKHDLSKITMLNLAQDDLYDISEEIQYFTNLEILYASNNELKSLPEGFSNLKKLKYLDLAMNKFSKFSPEIFHLSALEGLYLNSNLLTEIPSEISQLKNLYSLDIGDNRLKSLPKELADLPILREINLGSKGNENIQIPESLKNSDIGFTYD